MKSFRRAAILGAVALMATGLMSCRASAGDGYTSSAAAVRPFVWSGLYVSAGAGYAVGANPVSLDAPLYDNASANLDGLSTQGFAYDGRVGYDARIGQVIIGAFGGYSGGPQRFDFDATAGDFDGGVLNARIKPTWYGGGRIGLILPINALVYAGYAYSKANLDVSAFSGGGCAVCSDSRSMTGHNFLGGIELPIGPNMTVGAEYKYTMYDKQTWDFTVPGEGGPVTLATVSTKPEVHSIMGRLSVKTNILSGGN